VFITSKVWNDEQGYDGTLRALDRTLDRLDTDFLDLYLVHWPIRSKLRATWSAMQDALGQGKVRAIGVSNFLEPHLAELLEFAEVVPAVDQIEFHPMLQQPNVQAVLAEVGIVLQAWAPLIRGRVNDIPELREIGSTCGKSPAQVAIRWILQLGHTTIPKSIHADRIIENADVFDFELTAAEMEQIRGLDLDSRSGRDPNTMAWDY
jgi:diketogulonate reductase-like aldo/keto reductase